MQVLVAADLAQYNVANIESGRVDGNNNIELAIAIGVM
jgi:hypothetical protein